METRYEAYEFEIAIGRKDKKQRRIRRRRFRKARDRFESTVIERFKDEKVYVEEPGLTTYEAVGRTDRWKLEETSVSRTITKREPAAERILTEEAEIVRMDLSQSQVWITKKDVDLIVVKAASQSHSPAQED